MASSIVASLAGFLVRRFMDDVLELRLPLLADDLIETEPIEPTSSEILAIDARLQKGTLYKSDGMVQ